MKHVKTIHHNQKVIYSGTRGQRRSQKHTSKYHAMSADCFLYGSEKTMKNNDDIKQALDALEGYSTPNINEATTGYILTEKEAETIRKTLEAAITPDVELSSNSEQLETPNCEHVEGMPAEIYLYRPNLDTDYESLCWTKDESKGQTAYIRADLVPHIEKIEAALKATQTQAVDLDVLRGLKKSYRMNNTLQEYNEGRNQGIDDCIDHITQKYHPIETGDSDGI